METSYSELKKEKGWCGDLLRQPEKRERSPCETVSGDEEATRGNGVG